MAPNRKKSSSKKKKNKKAGAEERAEDADTGDESATSALTSEGGQSMLRSSSTARSIRGKETKHIAEQPLVWIESPPNSTAQGRIDEHQQVDTVDPSVLDQDDDIAQAVQWIVNGGSITSASLAKRLPGTAKRIRDEQVSPQGFARELASKVISSWAELAVHGERPNNVSFGDTDGTRILYLLGCGITRRVVSGNSTNDDLLREVMNDMQCTCRRTIRDASLTTDWKTSRRIALAWVVKRVFDQTFAKWEERLDARVFPGRPSGAYRRYCGLLIDAPIVQFNNVLVKEFYSNISDTTTQEEIYDCLLYDATHDDITTTRVYEDLKLRAETILQGADESDKVCWECGVELDAIKECAGCRVALYCVRRCQRKAWKGEHKAQCTSISRQRQNVLASLQAVDNAHRSGMVEGMRICQRFDYHFLDTLHNAASVYADASFATDLGLPNMEHFYVNLARVIRGESWLYDESNTPSAEEFWEISRTPENALEHFVVIAKFLAFDYFGFVSRRDRIHGPAQVTTFFEKSKSLADVTKHFGVCMSADIFLQMYRRKRRPVMGTEFEGLQLRTQSELGLLKQVREPSYSRRLCRVD